MGTRCRVVSLAIVAAVSLVALLATALAQTVLLDFEDHIAMDYWAGDPIPEPARLSDAYLTLWGVRFESGSPFVAVVELGSGHATSGVNGLGGSSEAGLLTYNRSCPIVITFFTTSDFMVPGITDFVSVRADRQGSSQTITLNAYDVFGNFVASCSCLDSGGATLTVEAEGIHRVVFLGSHSEDFGVALDDLRFNPVLPLPVTVGQSSWGRIKSIFCAAPN